MHDRIESAIPSFQDQQSSESASRAARWNPAAMLGLEKIEIRLAGKNRRTVKLLHDEPDDEERARQSHKRSGINRPLDAETKRKVRADMQRGAKLLRLAAAYSAGEVAKRYGLTKPQVAAACRRK